MDKLIALASEMIEKGEKTMDFKAFDKSEINNYKREAKERWSYTKEYREFEKKLAKCTHEYEKAAAKGLMQMFIKICELKNLPADDLAVQSTVTELKDYISEHYYTCTNKTLCGLGKMYVSDARFKQNIDNSAGAGTAEFVSKAIEFYCKK